MELLVTLDAVSLQGIKNDLKKPSRKWIHITNGKYTKFDILDWSLFLFPKWVPQKNADKNLILGDLWYSNVKGMYSKVEEHVKSALISKCSRKYEQRWIPDETCQIPGSSLKCSFYQSIPATG